MRFPLPPTQAGLFLIATAALAPMVDAAGPTRGLPPSAHHRIVNDSMPPGVIGATRAMARGPVHGYVQPVSFHGPEGIEFSMPQGMAFAAPQKRFWAGLSVGSVYRFRITGIPLRPGAELYPTIEIIDRTYPPPGLAMRHPVQIHLDREDLDAALAGQMVTRVVYLEDTESASPIAQDDQNRQPIDIAEYQDALEVADRAGRPLAIVRIGSMLPPRQSELMPTFCLGFPVWYPIHFPEAAAPTAIAP